MTWPIATTFDNVSTDAEHPSIAEHDDWTLTFSHDAEWKIDAQREGLVLPIRLANYYEPAEVAAYVRQQLEWVDSPPVVEPEQVEAEG